jgi:peptidoglycan/xylan/chitin deacetylase (PgdA/CDA1 family)
MKQKLLLINIILLFLLIFTGCNESVIQKPPPIGIPSNAKIICLFFDDGYKNQRDVVVPVLDKYNFKATFSIITDSIGQGTDLMEYMNVDEIKDLARDGMDIASHTVTHPHLLTLSDQELHDEIFNSKKTLEDLGFIVDTFIAPYYEWDSRCVDYVIAANYTCARGEWVESGIFDLSNSDPRARYQVTAMQMYSQDMVKFKKIVDKASGNNIVCLVYHLIADDGPELTSTPVKNFKAQMSYLNSAGFTVIPLVDVFRQ